MGGGSKGGWGASFTDKLTMDFDPYFWEQKLTELNLTEKPNRE